MTKPRVAILVLLCASMRVVAAAQGPLKYNLVGSAGDVITFQLPSQMPPSHGCFAHPPDCFGVSPVTVTFNGNPISGLEIEFFGSSEYGGLGIEMGNLSPEYVNTRQSFFQNGPLLFSGGINNPTLLTGTFSTLSTDLCCGALYTDPTWVLTVTQGCPVSVGLSFGGLPVSNPQAYVLATFIPPSNATLLDYAQTCGFDGGFDWQQLITVNPAHASGDKIAPIHPRDLIVSGNVADLGTLVSLGDGLVVS